MNYRKGRQEDLHSLKNLALAAWGSYQNQLTVENWERLKNSLENDETYLELLQIAYPFVCENEKKEIIGMAFLVPRGHPTEIYEAAWSYIRFVSVHPDYSGKGIGRELTRRCIDLARQNDERVIALHTSELMQKARHIYEDLGFRNYKEIPPRLGKKYWLYLLSLR